jgi:DNA-binding response OmpR family regulator
VSIKLLVARIEAVLRRYQQERAERASREVWVGDLHVDTERRQVTMAGRLVALTKVEFRLLAVLASQPGAIVSRDQLATDVWGYSDVSNSRTIDVHIRRLRVKLGQCRLPGPAILSVRGMGYRILADAAAITAA